MSAVTTFSRYASTMSALDTLHQTLIDNDMFDEANTVEDTLSFMRLLDGSGLLSPDPVEEAVDPSQEGLRQLCLRMRDLQARALDLKAQAADVRIPLDDLRLRQIPQMMDTLQIKTCTFAGIGRVQTAPDLYASTRKGKKEDAIQWLRDTGYEGMIKEGYNSSSIKALFRRMIEDGAEIPDDIFNITPFVRASIVRA